MTIHLPIGSIVAAGSAPSGNWKSAGTPNKYAREDGGNAVIGLDGSSSPPPGWSLYTGSFGWVASSNVSNLRPGDRVGEVGSEGEPATSYVQLQDEGA